MEKQRISQCINDKVKSLPVISKLECIFKYLRTGQIFRDPISWLYLLFALGFIALPLYFIYSTYPLFGYLSAMGIVGIILLYIIFLAAGTVGAIYWIDKSPEVANSTTSESKFVAIPIVTHLIRCIGESIGMLLIIFGPLLVLIAVIFMDDRGMGQLFSFSYIDILYAPISGFLLILATRVISEMISALAAIANNTSKD